MSAYEKAETFYQLSPSRGVRAEPSHDLVSFKTATSYSDKRTVFFKADLYFKAGKRVCARTGDCTRFAIVRSKRLTERSFAITITHDEGDELTKLHHLRNRETYHD